MKKKKKKKISFNTGLFWSLVAFSVLLLVVATFSVHYFNKMDQVYKVKTAINQLYRQYTQATQRESAFFNKEVYDAKFFKSGQSENLLRFKQKIIGMRDTITTLKLNNAYHDFAIASEINIIEEGLQRYQSLLESVVEKTIKKGYKDYGLEGKMGEFVHELESKSEKIGVDKVLMLRRHEKDYLLRNEQVYIEKLSVTIDALKTDILKSKDISVQEKDDLIVLLYNYFESFNALVHVGKEIGTRDEKGIYEMVSTCKISIERHFEIIQSKTIEKEAKIIDGLKKTYLMVAGNILIVSILLIYLFFRYRKNDDHENFDNQAVEVDKLNIAHGHLKQAQ